MKADSSHELTAAIDISENDTESNILELKGTAVVALLIPSALTSTALTFKAGFDPAALQDVYDRDGNQYSVTVAVDRWILIPVADIGGFPFLQIVMGSGEAADREIKVMTRNLN